MKAASLCFLVLLAQCLCAAQSSRKNVGTKGLRSIAVTPTDQTVQVPGTISYTATGTYTDGSTTNITKQSTWTASDSNVATLSDLTSTQNVQCKGSGNVTISASHGGITGSALLACQTTVMSMTISPTDPSQPVGSQQSFTAICVSSDGSQFDCTASSTWNSSDPGIATLASPVGDPETADCLRAGTSTITVTNGAQSAETMLTCTTSTSQACGPANGYACFRSDLNTTQYPSVPPQVGPNTCMAGNLTSCGNLTEAIPGKTTVVQDADFRSDSLPFGPSFARITDRCFVSGCNGYSFTARDNGQSSIFNVDSTALIVQSTGLTNYPVIFDGSTMQASRMYPSQPGGGFEVHESHTDWSAVDPHILYSLKVKSAPPQILKYDFSDQTTPPTPTVFYDWSTSPNCLPPTYKANWNVFGTKVVAMNGADTIFAASFSDNQSGTANVVNGSATVAWATGRLFDPRYRGSLIKLGSTDYRISAVAADGLSLTLSAAYPGATQNGISFTAIGSQETSVLVLVYWVGKGCTMLNTETGEVTGDWGFNGIIDGVDRFTIHSMTVGAQGNWIFIGSNNCLQPATGQTNCTHRHWWQPGTNVFAACPTNLCNSGEHALGASYSINNGEGYVGQFEKYSLSNFLNGDYSYQNIFPTRSGYVPPGLASPWVSSLSWNANTTGTDTVPLIISTRQSPPAASVEPAGPFPSAWYFEILSLDPNLTGTVRRLGHTLTTYLSGGKGRLDVVNGIGQASPDGCYFAFSSDWMGTLGSEGGSSSCTEGGTLGGTQCRGDVFVEKLCY